MFDSIKKLLSQEPEKKPSPFKHVRKEVDGLYKGFFHSLTGDKREKARVLRIELDELVLQQREQRLNWLRDNMPTPLLERIHLENEIAKKKLEYDKVVLDIDTEEHKMNQLQRDEMLNILRDKLFELGLSDVTYEAVPLSKQRVMRLYEYHNNNA